ncbi:endopeptidase La [Polyangium aurulentum]|uniref:endopeptidase La n=1 Tax=Polyangium aurulentum TaxID=2567896 RepID=UPI0010AED3F0|nr:endopeptidase La [Polyangium aurulentum]UQA59459.1 endopeptidase La [Polyangium aurulentum]
MVERFTLPVLPLRDTVVFPGVATPITAGRLKTLRAVELALREGGEDKRVFAVAQRDSAEEPTADGLHAVGVIARITQVQRLGSGLQLVLFCEKRATAIRYTETDGVLRAVTVELGDIPPRPNEESMIVALTREVRERALEYGKRRGAPEAVLEQFLGTVEDPGALANHVAFYLDLPATEKQALLETLSTEQRLRALTVHLYRQIGIAETQERIRTTVQEELGERQRELYLREQMKAIQKELGEDDDAGSTDRIEKKIEAAQLPSEVREEVRRELNRLKRMNRETSPEAQLLTNWLEWVAELPWNKRTDDHVDLARAREILDEDHYGLADVKDRVLEFLSVVKLRLENERNTGERAKAASRGPILLFLGPPGTGKTSIAESIARAMGRKYIRVSLGGARDEADIRGHRRTYVGALPGRILHGMKRVGSKNPVLTLDEIDKLGVSYQGDPAAALLEVLDPAQNGSFTDHYLGLPFDLSEVIFVCTANFREGIPVPLMDRMETIHFSGYTEIEKLEIGRRYLLPRQRRECGLRGDQLVVTDAALRDVITSYTREAGVRHLERTIGSLARKAARKIAEGEIERATVATVADVRGLLRKPRIRPEQRLEREEPGVATGMYYTEAGGDIMHVEASVMPGKGDLVLTGQLGDVMKESGRAALTYARTHAELLGLPFDRLQQRDFHVHVPAGAVPKDGPSAGVTMATALISAVSGRPVRSDIAMTGEITLRGRVLPIGGVKEKVLGAHRAGIPEIVLPRDNEADLEDLPEDVRRELQFHLVDTLDEVVGLALRPARQGVVRAA